MWEYGNRGLDSGDCLERSRTYIVSDNVYFQSGSFCRSSPPFHDPKPNVILGCSAGLLSYRSKHTIHDESQRKRTIAGLHIEQKEVAIDRDSMGDAGQKGRSRAMDKSVIGMLLALRLR